MDKLINKYKKDKEQAIYIRKFERNFLDNNKLVHFKITGIKLYKHKIHDQKIPYNDPDTQIPKPANPAAPAIIMPVLPQLYSLTVLYIAFFKIFNLFCYANSNKTGISHYAFIYNKYKALAYLCEIAAI